VWGGFLEGDRGESERREVKSDVKMSRSHMDHVSARWLETDYSCEALSFFRSGLLPRIL
jgi:hypothetical protein